MVGVKYSRQSTLGDRERQFASIIRQREKIGRREIHLLTGVHPTLTGNTVAALIESGLVREAPAPATPDRGRPQVPVEIDPQRRTFLGISIAPGVVRVARVDPTGKLREPEISKKVSQPNRLIETAAAMVSGQVDRATFAIGLSFTGLVDPKQNKILFSSSLPSSSAVSLAPIFDAAKKVPIAMHNDMHAMALRWMMTGGVQSQEVLLVGLEDGSLGAAVLINGQPQVGAVSAANELGHMRLAVETERCYCGQQGCLERIFSSGQLRRLGLREGRLLDDVISNPGKDEHAMEQILDHLTTGIANAVNFIRPEKLVIASPMVRHAVLVDFLREELPARILPGLRERVEIVFWQHSCVQSAENAAWLALADVFGSPLGGI